MRRNSSTSFDFSCSFLFDFSDRQEKKFKRIQAHTDFIESCCFSNDGSLLATSSGDETLKVWKVNEELSLLKTFQGHEGVIWDCDFNIDSSLLCSCSSDKTVRVWDLTKERELKKKLHSATLWVCRFCPGFPTTVASCSSENNYEIVIWDFLQDSVIQIIEGHRNIVEDITFSPDDGSTLASCSRDKDVFLWRNYQTAENSAPIILSGHKARVNSCAFSPVNDDMLVSCSSDLTIIVWDTVEAEKLHVMYGHCNAIWKCAFGLHNGHVLLATCSSDRSLRIWDPISGCELKKFVNFDSHLDPRAQLFCCAFSGNGTTNESLLAVVSLEGGLYIARVDDIINDEIEMLQ